MHLVVDVGNTETVIGLFSPDSLDVSVHLRYATAVTRTADELSLLIRSLLADTGHTHEEVDRKVLGSVVPVQTELLQRTLATIGTGEVVVLEGVDSLPIRLDVEEPPLGVGADRIANTLAAAHLYQRDTVVVDLGTATTYDCITAEGVFCGGVIAPGLLAGEEWLAGRTDKLPRVSFRRPEQVVGHRTEDCLRSGVFFSAIDAVDGLIERILEEWNRADAHVVATGGHASAVATHSRFLEMVDPNLTLIGLEIAGRHLSSSA